MEQITRDLISGMSDREIDEAIKRLELELNVLRRYEQMIALYLGSEEASAIVTLNSSISEEIKNKYIALAKCQAWIDEQNFLVFCDHDETSAPEPTLEEAKTAFKTIAAIM